MVLSLIVVALILLRSLYVVYKVKKVTYMLKYKKLIIKSS